VSLYPSNWDAVTRLATSRESPGGITMPAKKKAAAKKKKH
jgi:hypothetical protein